MIRFELVERRSDVDLYFPAGGWSLEECNAWASQRLGAGAFVIRYFSRERFVLRCWHKDPVKQERKQQ